MKTPCGSAKIVHEDESGPLARDRQGYQFITSLGQFAAGFGPQASPYYRGDFYRTAKSPGGDLRAPPPDDIPSHRPTSLSVPGDGDVLQCQPCLSFVRRQGKGEAERCCVAAGAATAGAGSDKRLQTVQRRLSACVRDEAP
jgi:hypothetical protein